MMHKLFFSLNANNKILLAKIQYSIKMKTNFYTLAKFTFFFFAFFVFSRVQAQNIHVYASPYGAATGNGDVATAPVNLDRARAIVRANPTKPCVVSLASGSYSALSLDATDSRAAAYPAVYTSMVPNGAVFQPEILLNRANFQAIPATIAARIINATAKTKVMQLSLASYNLPDTAQWAASFAIGYLKTPRFYKNGQPLPMSRYPADTTMAIKQVVTKGASGSTPGGSFKYRDDRAKYWLNAINDGGLWLSGNWQAPWQMDVIKTKSITTADSLIVQAVGIGGGLGTILPTKILPGTEPYYALNLVEEIAAEGQWSFNAKTKMLYMWPPALGNLAVAGNAKAPAISATNVSNVQFTGIAVSGGSGNGVELNNCNNVLLAGMHITYCSGNGIYITDGSNCTVQSNDIDSVGAGGVVVTNSNFNADQLTLKSCGHKIINNHIYTFAREAVLYSAAINVNYAIGAYVAYNKVHDCPHVGIQYGGNNNILEYNEMYDVDKNYTDMGAFYSFGITRGWESRGNKVRHNYIHDAPKANGIYLDEYASGDSINYNIVANTVMGLYNHYGYFNVWANNITIDNTYPITSMAEATTDSYYAANMDSLRKIWGLSAIYRKAYPEVSDMVSVVRNDNYSSHIWPQVIGGVNMGSIGTLSNVIDHRLFNDDGTTNATYAQTGPAFTTWSTVFQNNRKISDKLVNPIVPFKMDSVRASGAFGVTGGTDWHINRIGIHKDAYRTNVSSIRLQGVDPTMTLVTASTNKFVTGGIVTLTASVKFPNAANIFSAVAFYDNGKPITGITITKKSVTYDSATYTLVWANPAVGYHNIILIGNDGDGTFWQYLSNYAGFTIKSATTTAAANDLTTVARAAEDTTAKADSSVWNTSQLTLYPNPARDQINLNFTSSKALGNTNVTVYDLVGRVLVRKIITVQEGPNQLTIPLSNVPNGTYLVVLQSPNSPANSKQFVIQH